MVRLSWHLFLMATGLLALTVATMAASTDLGQDVILAHSLLRSWPRVDPERIGLTGISWGGYLTCIATGVDNRFKFAIPVSPAHARESSLPACCKVNLLPLFIDAA